MALDCAALVSELTLPSSSKNPRLVDYEALLHVSYLYGSSVQFRFAYFEFKIRLQFGCQFSSVPFTLNLKFACSLAASSVQFSSVQFRFVYFEFKIRLQFGCQFSLVPLRLL
jgi:hypothetical protein